MTKFFVGVAILVALYMLTPLFDLFQTFIAVVIIPLLALFSLGLLGAGALEGIMNVGPDILARAKERAREIRDNINPQPTIAE